MSVRIREAGEILTTKQKVCLVLESGGSIDSNVDDMKYEDLIEKSVRAKHLRVAGLGPRWLAERGCPDAHGLRRIGFDSLDLCDDTFLESAVAAFGAEEVHQAFLANGEDALNLVNTNAASVLKLDAKQLLEACAGDPRSALEVLQLLPTTSLKSLTSDVFLDAGVRAASLKKIGINSIVLREMGPVELQRLGFL